MESNFLFLENENPHKQGSMLVVSVTRRKVSIQISNQND